MATDCEVMGMMARYGGSFVRSLAQLCYRSDPLNLARIKATWPDYWAKYTMMVDQQARERDASAR